MYPLTPTHYRVEVMKRLDLPLIGPIIRTAILDHQSLAALVRTTALNANVQPLFFSSPFPSFLHLSFPPPPPSPLPSPLSPLPSPLSPSSPPLPSPLSPLSPVSSLPSSFLTFLQILSILQQDSKSEYVSNLEVRVKQIKTIKDRFAKDTNDS